MLNLSFWGSTELGGLMSRSVYRGGTRVLSLLCATMVALTMFVVTGARSVAEAAINNQITFPQIEIIRTDKGGNPAPSPDPLRIWEYAKLNIKFDATQANPQPGDSFEIEAPVYFALRESGEFPMTDTDGSPAGTCLLQERGGKPFITCTFGQAIAGKSDVEGTVAIGLQVEGGSGSGNAEIRINGQIHSVPLPNGQIVPPQFYNEPKVDKWLQSLVAKDSRYLQWSVQLGGKYWSDHKNELGDPISITDELQPGLEYVTGDPRHPVELLEVCADPAGPTGQKETVIARVGEPNIGGNGFSVELTEDPGDPAMAHITFRGPIKGTCNYRVYYYTKFPNGETINKGQRYGNKAKFDGTGDSDDAWGFYVESFQAIVNFKDGFGSFKVTKLVNGDGFPGGQQFDVSIAYVLPDGKGPGDFPGWVAPSNPTRYTVKVGEGATYVAAFPVGTVVTLTEDVTTANPAPTTGQWGEYSFASNEAGVNITEGGKKAQFTVVNQKALALELTNTWTPKEYAPLEIRKLIFDEEPQPAVVGSDPAGNDVNDVTPAAIGDGKEFAITYECNSPGKGTTPATGTVSVPAGGKVVVGEFPVGTTCDLTGENDVVIDGYEFQMNFSNGPIQIEAGEDNILTMYNYYTPKAQEFGTFTVAKAVVPVGQVGVPGEFTVDYSCSAAGRDGVAQQGSVRVAAGAETRVGEFPVGTVCEVTGEDEAAAGIAGFNLVVSKDGPVTLVKDAVSKVTVTNTYSEKVGRFSISKSVVADPGVVAPGEFRFWYQCGGDAQRSVMVAAGGVWTSPDLPAGTRCVVKEDLARAFVDGAELRTDFTGDVVDGVVTIGDGVTAGVRVTNTYVPELVSVGDFVWWDVNRDGQQTGGEPVAVGVEVALQRGDGSVVATTVTDADGFYWFKDLAAGRDYRLVFTAPDGASWTVQDQGGDDAKDSDVNPDGLIEFTAPAVGVNAGGAPDKTDDPRLDAGLVRYNLKLVKTLDAASKKQVNAGDEVTFLLTPHNDGPVAALPGWSITDVLPAGLTLVSMTGDAPWYDCLANVCTAKESLGAGADGPVVKITAKVDEAVPADALTNGLVNIAYITPAPADGPETVPLGEDPGKNPPRETPTDNDDDEKVEIARVSIGDFVWWDVDRNGLQDNDEPPVPGVKVVLKDAAGQVVGETTTDEYGYYGFKDLTPNAGYRLEFTAPEGASWTIQDQGGDDAKDSDVNPDGLIEFTSPVSGNNSIDRLKTDNPALDAGLVKYNLVLVKDQQGHQKVKVGDQITYTLTPSNQGPADALAGWSITDVLPDYLELVSISGEGYTCDLTNPKAPTCTNPEPLGAGSPAKPVTVVVKVLESASGVIRNTGYITPAPTDTPETNPLGTPPTPTTDTTTTTTDNDSHKDTILNRTPPTTKPGPPKTGS